MSAVHSFSESNGIGEVVSDGISNVNFGNADEANIVPASHPVNAGEASFEKYIRCLFSGVWTEISNMKFWKSAGSYVTGEAIKAAANVAFATPSQTVNADSDIPTALGSALAILSAEGASTIEYGVSGVSGYTKYIRMQAQTTSSSPAGNVNQKTFTFQYDEI